MRAGFRTFAAVLRVCLPIIALCGWPAAGLAAEEDDEELEQGRDAGETYELNALNLVHQRVTKVTLLGIALVKSDSWQPVRGKHRWGLSREEFFLRVGRPDLAAEQNSSDLWSDVLFYGGFVVALGGIAYPFLTRDEEDGVQTSGLLIGGGIFLGGVVASNIGAANSGPVVDADAAGELANRYNERLRTRLSAARSSTPLQLGARVSTARPPLPLQLQVGAVNGLTYRLQF